MHLSLNQPCPLRSQANGLGQKGVQQEIHGGDDCAKAFEAWCNVGGLEMIDRKSYKVEVFWKRIEKIFGEASFQCVPLKRNNYQTIPHEDYGEVIYLGGGYWRCMPIHNEVGDVFIGVRMINPSLSFEQIDTVEKAFWLIP